MENRAIKRCADLRDGGIKKWERLEALAATLRGEGFVVEPTPLDPNDFSEEIRPTIEWAEKMRPIAAQMMGRTNAPSGPAELFKMFEEAGVSPFPPMAGGSGAQSPLQSMLKMMTGQLGSLFQGGSEAKAPAAPSRREQEAALQAMGLQTPEDQKFVERFTHATRAAADLLASVVENGDIEPYRDRLSTALDEYADCKDALYDMMSKRAMQAPIEMGLITTKCMQGTEHARLENLWEQLRTQHRTLYRKHRALFEPLE
jgi:hypothetical protein